MFFDHFEDLVSERMWARSRALEDAIELVWRERVDEGPPLLFPRGRVFGNGIVVVNAPTGNTMRGSSRHAIRRRSGTRGRVGQPAARFEVVQLAGARRPHIAAHRES